MERRLKNGGNKIELQKRMYSAILFGKYHLCIIGVHAQKPYLLTRQLQNVKKGMHQSITVYLKKLLLIILHNKYLVSVI